MNKAEMERGDPGAHPAPAAGSSGITIGMAARFLVGDRRAILALASNRWALAVGAVLVISGGLARNYDHRDLVHEPWHALHGFGATGVLAVALFGLVYAVARMKRLPELPGFGRGCLAFLGVLWMMAPMAWLYGVPYERFLSPIDSIRANLWTLAFVAIWRVVLVSRVLAVLFGCGMVRALFLTMFVADAIAIPALGFADVPTIDFMGGLNQTDEERLVASVAFDARVLSVVTAPVWVIGGLVSCVRMKGRWAARLGSGERPRALLVAGAVAALAGWGVGAGLVQREQVLRSRAERLLMTGDIVGAFAEMSAHSREEYPPGWNPPPRLGYRERIPDVGVLRDALDRTDAAPWVQDLFVGKVRRLVRMEVVPVGGPEWHVALESLSKPWLLAREHSASIEFLLRRDPTLTPEDRGALERFAAQADLRTAPLDFESGQAEELMREVVLHGTVEDVRTLMERADRAGRREGMLEAALDEAIGWSKEDLFEHLLTTYWNVPGPTGCAERLLLHAADEGSARIISMIVALPEDIDVNVARSSDGKRPLHLAVRRPPCVKVLLRAGADPNGRAAGGRTPLHAAVGESNSESVSLLLDGGADPRLATDHGVTVVDLANRSSGREASTIAKRIGEWVPPE